MTMPQNGERTIEKFLIRFLKIINISLESDKYYFKNNYGTSDIKPEKPMRNLKNCFLFCLINTPTCIIFLVQ